MKNNRFWNWVRNEETGASEMYLYGAIAESTWFENDITPCHVPLGTAKTQR